MDEELEVYADPDVTSRNAKIDGWLKFVYIVLPIWGVIWMYLYWNGSHGWLDRGYWEQLQRVANTMFPLTNYNDPQTRSEEN